MPLDTLICGLCEETFTDLNDFVLHKQTGCSSHGGSRGSTRSNSTSPPQPPPPPLQAAPSIVKEEEEEVAMVVVEHHQEISPPPSLPLPPPPPLESHHHGGPTDPDHRVVVPVGGLTSGEEGGGGHVSKLPLQGVAVGGDVDPPRHEGGPPPPPDLTTFLEDVHTMECELVGLVDQHPPTSPPTATHTYVILKDAGTAQGGEGHEYEEGVAKMETAFATLEGSELEVLSASHQLMTSASSSTSMGGPGGGGGGGTTTVVISQEEFEAILNKQQQQHHQGQITIVKEELPAKKPRVGRAKKGEGKNQILEAVPPSTPRPSAPETNADGKLSCPQCKRTFTKERHFNTHKCLASSSYLDISKRDLVKIDSGDEEEDLSLYLDVDDGGHHGNHGGGHDDDDGRDGEFSQGVEDSLEAQREEEEDEDRMDKEEEEGEEEGGQGHGGVDGQAGPPAPKRRKVVGRRRGRPARAKALLEESSLEGGGGLGVSGGGGSPMKQAVEAMENLPIFKNDEDKVAFEACIDVDLSQVDHMFRVHVIEQELNTTSGVVYNTPTVSSLSVYSCGVCEKVFKSLSHIRLHCITHTDLKPFKCNKCDYTTNSKGNLYTHMRKHTGQFYRCEQCEFKTVNKSHLVEHQMTHDSRRPTCLLCHKDYSTVKSMINHIRKYHTNKAGRDYLATFLSGRGQKGNAIIHQCHVCNRKFKKRIDRDRHLFIHDIKDLPNVQMCELCDYWASRKVYLDKHYSKHRVIYCCVLCQTKFLSVTRLSEHLTVEHCPSSENSIMVVSDALLQECINKSFYLPEPMATTAEGSKYVNLPTVLTDSAQGQTQDEGQQQHSQMTTEEEKLCASNATDNGETTGSNPTARVSDENKNNGDDDSKNNSGGFNSAEAGDDEDHNAKLLGLTTDESSDVVTTAAAKMETGSDPDAGLGHGDLVVSAASTSSDTTAFPFSSEYRELIHATAQEVDEEGEEEGRVARLKTDEEEEENGIMMMMPSPDDPMTDVDNNPVVACLSTGDGGVGRMAEEEQKADTVVVIPGTISTTGAGDEDEDRGAGGGGTVEVEESGHEGIPPTNILMLQNPGSDSEEKEEERGEEEVERGQGGVTGVVGEEEEGEATPVPQLVDDEDDGLDKESDNGSQEGNAIDKGEGQTEVSVVGGQEVKGEGSKVDKIQSIIDKMGYRKMTFDIFNKMRETFGSEECEYCGRLFYNKMDHQMHVRTHTGDKPFACAHCSFRATTRDGLRRHSEKEHEKIAYQCKECDFLAPTRTRLWNHQLKHLGITGLSCSQCPEKFDSMKQLRAHLLNSHQDMDRDDLEKLTGYIRRPQGKMGRRSFKCPHCPRVFIRANSELQKHIWIHEGIKPFACPLCPYACRSKNNLQAHMLRHSAEKPFSCSECGKEYKSKTALRWHVRSHKSGKLFKCDKCPYEATQSSHLKRHMEIHDVMKRFVCKHCQFSANTLGYMKIHYAKHHKGQPFIQEESSPAKDTLGQAGSGSAKGGVFKCLSCGYLFGNLSDLKRHLKVRHHVQIQDIAGMDQMHISEVEVVQFDDTAVVMGSTSGQQTLPDVHQIQQVVQPAHTSTTTTPGEFQLRPQDENVSAMPMPASTASLIQQILGMDQGENQQVRVVSEDGQPLDISSDTIILQQDGQLLMTNEMPGGSLLPGNQYIIQYFNPGEVEVTTAIGDHTPSAPTPNQPIVSVASPDQIHLVQSHPPPTQFIIAPSQVDGQHPPPPPPHSVTVVQQQQPPTHQYVVATPPTPTNNPPTPQQQPQIISIDGQTHHILSAPTPTISPHPLPGGHQLMAEVVEDPQYITTSDPDAYSSTQLIISDHPGVDMATSQ